MVIRGTIILAVSLVLVNGLAIAGTNQIREPPPKAILNGCEGNNSYLSNAHHLAGAEGTIIAIASLGDGERSQDLNRRRLHNVREFLTDFGWHREPGTVVTAQGERVLGYGTVKLYVRGNLFAILAVKRNQDLLVGSCVGPDSNLYPYLTRKAQKPTAKP